MFYWIFVLYVQPIHAHKPHPTQSHLHWHHMFQILSLWSSLHHLHLLLWLTMNTGRKYCGPLCIMCGLKIIVTCELKFHQNIQKIVLHWYLKFDLSTHNNLCSYKTYWLCFPSFKHMIMQVQKWCMPTNVTFTENSMICQDYSGQP